MRTILGFIVVVIIMAVVLFLVGCESEQQQSYQPRTLKAKKLTAPASQPTGQSGQKAAKYDYQHSIQKGQVKTSDIGQDRPRLKHRIAVARFGDMSRPWGSPFDPPRVGEVRAQRSTKLQADDDGVVLEQKELAQLGQEIEPCPAFTGLLIDALVDSGRFIVVERKDINKLLLEQEFGQSGRVLRQSSADLRKIRGVELIITGQVANVSTKGDDATKATLVAMRIYNVETAEVIASARVQSQSVHDAVAQASEKVTGMIKDVPWSSKVSKVQNPSVIYLNCGSDDGVYEGDRFEIYSLGEEIYDPDEGTVLGCEKTLSGVVEVTYLDEKFCKAMTLAKRRGSKYRYKRGDLAEFIMGPYSDDLSDYQEQLKGTVDPTYSDRQDVGVDTMDPEMGGKSTGPSEVDDRNVFQKAGDALKPKSKPDSGSTEK